jgi:hypothetical protein
MHKEILYLYPSAIPLVDFILEDSGTGAGIKYWNTAKLGVQPSVEALLATVVPPEPVLEVQMRQARLALLQAGYYDTVQAAINAIPGAAGKAAQIEWQVSNTLRRNHPLVASMGGVLGLTAAQLDGLFTLANTL